MRMWKVLVVGALMAGFPAYAGSAEKKTWTFEDDTPGAIAKAFINGSGDWKVMTTPEGKVLAQLAESPTSEFNVALVDGIDARDLDLSVKLKVIGGKTDQGGGLVWRAKDAKNYYIARFNHKEDNFRVYKVIDGVPSSPFQNADVKHHDGWTVLRVTMKGNHIECFIDGNKYLDVIDSTFSDSGKIGVWSKSDARSQFDDLTIASEPEQSPLERIHTIALKGPVGGLDHLAIDSRRGRLFVANTSNNSLDVVDIKAGKLLKQIPGQGRIRGIAYAPDLDRIFVGNATGGLFNAFDGQEYGLLKSMALGDGADNVRYNPATRRIYVAHADEELAVIEAESYATRSPIPLPKDVGGFQLDSRRPRMYLNSKSVGQVFVIDLDKDKIIDRFPVAPAGMNAALAIDESNRRLFVGCRLNPSLIVMDSETGKVIALLPIPGDADDVYFDTKNHRIYISCGDGSIAVIRQKDADHYESMTTIPTVRGARTSIFDAETAHLFLAVPRRAERPDQENPEIWIYRVKP